MNVDDYARRCLQRVMPNGYAVGDTSYIEAIRAKWYARLEYYVSQWEVWIIEHRAEFDHEIAHQRRRLEGLQATDYDSIPSVEHWGYQHGTDSTAKIVAVMEAILEVLDAATAGMPMEAPLKRYRQALAMNEDDMWKWRSKYHDFEAAWQKELRASGEYNIFYNWRH